LSEQKNICSMLDGFTIGNPMSNHDGIRCCPAIKDATGEKYIVKIISIPESQVQLDALLLTGAYKDPAEAADYFRDVAEEIVRETEYLSTVAKLDGFLAFESSQIVPMEDGKLGYQVYLLSPYRRSLLRYMRRNPLTHLEAVNLGLDLCAALAICRRSGYLYVDLKPANIFLSREKQFRIGDLGFVKLDSLDYTSLPGKYRSFYAPPECQDDLKTLNETVDTYALGMILYQIYNNGELPEAPRDPREPFPCPENADYEISSVIMKAIDPDPVNRWSDPMAMGQALVAYMQRNTVNNIPITPPSGIQPDVTPVPAASSETSSDEPEAVPASDLTEAEAPVEAAAEPAPTERNDDTESTADAEDVIQLENTAELEKNENPEGIIPEPEDDLDDLDFSIAFEDPALPVVETPTAPEPKPIPVKKQRSGKKSHAKTIISLLAILLLLAALALGGFWFYQTQYLQTIDSLTVDGTQNELVVKISTRMDEKKLQISCTDAYGNTTVKAVTDGQAVFTDLLPDSLYRIEVTATGFHQLTGTTNEIFTTESISNIVSISAIAGPEDGSAVLSFTVDGPDPEEWTVTCTTDGEEPIVQSFTGHTVTVKGLTVGKVYQMDLGTSDGTQVMGSSTVYFTATNLIMAENLAITGCKDGIMSVRWDAPEGVNVERWNVRCYNDDGHEEVLQITGTEFDFAGIDNSIAYTVEVTAEGMTEPSRVTLTPNPITITGLTVDTSDPMRLSVNWTYDGNAPQDGWLLLYSMDNLTQQQSVVKAADATAVIEPRIPGATYNFQIQAADSTSLFGSTQSFQCPDAEIFNDHDLSANHVTAHLLKTPEEDGWTAETIGNDLYTDTFQPGDAVSVVLKASEAFELPKDVVVPVLYVIRDSEGNVLSKYVSEENVIWKDLWYPDNYHNCELNIPKIPAEPGTYSLSIYFNYHAMASADFTIQ